MASPRRASPGLRDRRRREGFTLVETLVVLTVLLVLVALIMPAVQASREAARRVTCTNNLRQLGLAVHAYAASAGVLPLPYGGGKGGSLSAHARLLPYLGEGALAAAVDYDDSSTSAANRAAGRTKVATFLCPSDNGFGLPGGWTNYAVNAGTGIPGYQDRGLFSEGAFGVAVSLGDFTDGTSYTAGVAEWVIASGDPGSRDLRATAFIAPGSPIPPMEFERLVERCRGLDPRTTETIGSKGQDWIEGALATTIYNHAVPINGPSCSNDGTINGGAWTAGSRHPGGANVLMMDGHVRFLSESIAPATWRALGTRAGGEIVSEY